MQTCSLLAGFLPTVGASLLTRNPTASTILGGSGVGEGEKVFRISIIQRIRGEPQRAGVGSHLNPAVTVSYLTSLDLGFLPL